MQLYTRETIVQSISTKIATLVFSPQSHFNSTTVTQQIDTCYIILLNVRSYMCIKSHHQITRLHHSPHSRPLLGQTFSWSSAITLHFPSCIQRCSLRGHVVPCWLYHIIIFLFICLPSVTFYTIIYCINWLSSIWWFPLNETTLQHFCCFRLTPFYEEQPLWTFKGLVLDAQTTHKPCTWPVQGKVCHYALSSKPGLHKHSDMLHVVEICVLFFPAWQSVKNYLSLAHQVFSISSQSLPLMAPLQSFVWRS